MFANVENTYIIETIPCLTDIWVLVEYTREEEHLSPEIDHTYFGGEMEKSTPFCVELPCVSTSIKEITHQLNILTGHSSLNSSCACRETNDNGEKARNLISTNPAHQTKQLPRSESDKLPLSSVQPKGGGFCSWK
jgi:hypothetical protein